MRNYLMEIKEKVLVYDGSKGVLLQKLGLQGGDCPELWNVTHGDEVRKIYAWYKEAGSDVIQTNTFQGNRIVLEKYGLGSRTHELNIAGARLAREVMGQDGFVAASVGPIGQLMEPSGELTFDKAYEAFKEQVQALEEGGVDIIHFETFTDLAEMRAALLAAKENTRLPVICTLAFEANGRTLMGTDPFTAGVVLKSLGADMIGTNCSFGPEHMLEIVRKISEVGGIPLCVKPNAGLPEMVDGVAVFKESPEMFASLSKDFVNCGARLIGGCCGTTPEHIKAIKARIHDLTIPKPVGKSEKLITSNSKTLFLDGLDKLNAGQMDAENDEELHKALSEGNLDMIMDRALDIACEGFDAIYINIDGVQGKEGLLADVVNLAQGYIKEPIIIETSDPEALSKALRIYKGKAGVVVNGYPTEVVEALLKTAKKFGSTIIDKKAVI